MMSRPTSMMAVINVCTIAWFLLSLPQMIVASVVTSLVTLRTTGNEAATHPIEHLLSSHRLHRGYEKSLALINSLNLPHSCLYSSLTESIISKCSSAPTTLDGEEKNFFATKLAICELASASVDYPRQCRGDIQSPKDVQRCIGRLETRPQWWTSWSNCIQSVGVLCQAVREEAERENLLKLHRNLTILHYQLENQLATSLNLFSSHFQQVDESSAMVHSKLASLVGEVDNFVNKTISPMGQRLQYLKNFMDEIGKLQTAHAVRLAEQNVAFNEQTHAQRQAIYKAGDMIGQVLDAMEILDSKLNTRIKLDEEARIEQLEQMQIAIKSSTADTLEAIKRSMQSLSELTSLTGTTLTSLIDSISEGQMTMDSLNQGFDGLSASHERISQSMHSQEESSNRQLRSVSQFALIFNETLINILSESSSYLQKLENAHMEFQKQTQPAMAPIAGLALISTYLPILISILVVLDRKRSAIAIIFFAALYTFFLTYPLNSGLDTSYGEEVGAEGLLLDSGSHQYRWFQDCCTMIMGYIRSFW